MSMAAVSAIRKREIHGRRGSDTHAEDTAGQGDPWRHNGFATSPQRPSTSAFLWSSERWARFDGISKADSIDGPVDGRMCLVGEWTAPSTAVEARFKQGIR